MKKKREFKFKVRRLSGYVLKLGMLAVLVGALVNLVLLITQYTTVDPSTKEDIITPVANDTNYLIAGTVCNTFGIITLAVYYFMVARQYRPYKEIIKPNRMFHVLVAMALAMLSIAVAFVMMGWTYKSFSSNRNLVAIGLLVVIAATNLAAVGYEQWAVFEIERDILRARTPVDDKPAQADEKSGKADNANQPQEGDDPRASANPKSKEG